jgi:hypothetical protein
MPIYQNATMNTDKVEIGNYTISVGAKGTSAGGTWVNLGAGTLKDFAYVPELINSQAGNALVPLYGTVRETATFSFDLIEYDGSAFSALSGGMMSGTSGSVTVGGLTSASILTGKGIKLVNNRKLASGSAQTTTIVCNECYLNSGWTIGIKSDNDTDPISVYSFAMTAIQYATAGNVYYKTVA